MHRGSEKQLQALKTAFHEFIPEITIQEFSVEEIELLISGEASLDIKDWKSNTVSIYRLTWHNKI